MSVKTFNELKKNRKKDFSGFPKAKLAVLGDSATQLLVQAIRGFGYEVQVDLDIFEAEYNQVDRQILDPSSDLYQSQSEFVLLVESSPRLLSAFYKTAEEERVHFAESRISRLREMYHLMTERMHCRVICFNFPEIDDSVFGNYANQVPSSFLFQLRKLNYLLMELADELGNLFIADAAALQSRLGDAVLFDAKLWVNSSMAYGLEILPYLAKNTVDIIQSIRGSFKKCLILDLDNTTWGGIIGDDGMENIQIGTLGIGKAFTELQKWAKELKKRGIILCICSKNTEHIAKEPFEKHPEMVLRLEDIAIFVANWETKVDNIRHIQKILNIGFDSIVFLDDNPFEREIVRTNIPGITVPELPVDPTEYLSYLRTLNLWETASFSGNDEKRTRQYQEESKRVSVQKAFQNEEDFLGSLEMTSLVSESSTFNTPRIAQLSQRSNQFNLRTVRYTEEDVEQMQAAAAYKVLAYTLKDKFGEYGLISVIILKFEREEAFIDTWIMSCRVLKRGMEKFALNTLVEFARENGCKQLIGEYLPTPKNGIVKDHYADLGFEEKEGKWRLDVEGYEAKQVFISKGVVG